MISAFLVLLAAVLALAGAHACLDADDIGPAVALVLVGVVLMAGGLGLASRAVDMDKQACIDRGGRVERPSPWAVDCITGEVGR